MEMISMDPLESPFIDRTLQAHSHIRKMSDVIFGERFTEIIKKHIDSEYSRYERILYLVTDTALEYGTQIFSPLSSFEASYSYTQKEYNNFYFSSVTGVSVTINIYNQDKKLLIRF